MTPLRERLIEGPLWADQISVSKVWGLRSLRFHLSFLVALSS